MSKLVKTLVIINGAPGVGKTEVTKRLYKRIRPSAWLDGDWCWKINPFEVNDENKRLVESNMIHILNNYLHHKKIEVILFNWVIPMMSLMDHILKQLDLVDVRVLMVTLMCDPEILKKRLLKDQRSQDNMTNSLKLLKKYKDMDTIKIDTSSYELDEVVDQIIKIMDEEK